MFQIILSLFRLYLCIQNNKCEVFLFFMGNMKFEYTLAIKDLQQIPSKLQNGFAEALTPFLSLSVFIFSLPPFDHSIIYRRANSEFVA